jgi:hypothetical protein
LFAAKVIVTINTEADQSLQFGPPWSPSSPVIPITVSEEIPIGTKIKTLEATDPQTNEPVRNFRIVDGTDPDQYFSIDPNTGIYWNESQ